MKVEEVKGVDKEDVFAGWEEPSEIDFFGTDSPVVKVVEEEKKESEEKEEIAAEKKTEEEGAIENIDFFLISVERLKDMIKNENYSRHLKFCVNNGYIFNIDMIIKNSIKL